MRRTIYFTALVFSFIVTGCDESKLESEDFFRNLEKTRLKSLVEADMETAKKLHSDDFRLINPFGQLILKDGYLEGIENGGLDYLFWEATDPIEVEISSEMATLRYRSQIEVNAGGQHYPINKYWHTDVYVKEPGGWKVVFSQATQIVGE